MRGSFLAGPLLSRAAALTSLAAGVLITPTLRAQSVSAASSSASAYARPSACAQCHAAIWQTYQRTAMGRSFYKPNPRNQVEDFTKNYLHGPSATYYAMVLKDGTYYQRQYQLDYDGKQTNVSESSIDFIVGSGNHSRTYLHRTAKNTLIELPLAWYSEKGGYWAMNPGYDRTDHQSRRRLIGYECMFCHNGYPDIPAGAGFRSEPVFLSVPEGIDCQRCHGPGARHVALARQPGAPQSEIRAAIVNPARLAPDRQSEVCLQCHLETTSLPLPNSLVRNERAPFSFRPGEPLADYMLHFDRAPGSDQDTRFEIAGSAYRLARSACFQKSNGALKCTTCHNPHDVPRGEAASKHYTAVCRECHGATIDRLAAAGKHTGANDCTRCHMPKRRTQDVVHAVMTDHYIQRLTPAGDLLADIAEPLGDAKSYQGEVVLYYPKTLPRPEDELYLAVAQVQQQSNLTAGIERLTAAIDKYKPAGAEYYLDLADAWRLSGKPGRALPAYVEALRRNPNSLAAMQNMALCFISLHDAQHAVETLKRALASAPQDAPTWDLLGTAYAEQNQRPEALAAFQQAIDLDNALPEAYNSLGGLYLKSGDSTKSEPLLRNAILLDPNYAQAHNNLANLLASTGRLPEARYHFEAALRVNPKATETRYDYAVALARAGQRDEAEKQLEAAIQRDPNSAEAHEFLGTLLAARRQFARAIEQYRTALRIRPDFARANLHLGESLADTGDASGAKSYLEQAAKSTDTAIRQEALAVLKQLDAAR
ncbi:MAG TPA: tetratricopeptide repeat protein [Bryobacteraceae bacterium]|nr:tetratricopeptide repeat protein [Bryobacteraceae bacterium]